MHLLTKMKIRYKFFLTFLVFNMGISLLLGYSMYHITYSLFFELFRESKISLARSLALSIDADQHQTWLDDSAQKDPIYKKMNLFLQSIVEKEEYTKFLYTINYVKEKDSFYYALSGLKMEQDTFWCETKYFAFNISTDKEGKVFVEYNDEKYYENFETLEDTNKNKFQFSLKEVNGNKTLFVEDKPIFTITSINPLRIKSPSNKIIDSSFSVEESTFFLNEQEISYSVFLSNRGDLDLYPGMPVVNSNIEE